MVACASNNEYSIVNPYRVEIDTFLASNIEKWKEKLIDASNLMEQYNPAEVSPVVSFSFPPQRCYIIDEKNYLCYKYKEFASTRSQDLEKCYHDVGQFYVYNVKKFFDLDGKNMDDKIPILQL